MFDLLKGNFLEFPRYRHKVNIGLERQKFTKDVEYICYKSTVFACNEKYFDEGTGPFENKWVQYICFLKYWPSTFVWKILMRELVILGRSGKLSHW
jgi:hypothetical protein